MKSSINIPKVQFLTIGEGALDQRIDNFLIARLKGVPKSLIYRKIRKGEVRVNKKRVKPEYKLKIGDEVRIPPITVNGSETPQVSPRLDSVKKLEASILYEDATLLVLNKPSGLAVHGGSGLKFGAVEALRALRPEQKFIELVHRLDRDTSGCLVFAKKRSALRALHQQLREKTVDKRYFTLVKGRWPPRLSRVDYALTKNMLSSGERIVRVDPDGKPSLTCFRIKEELKGATLIEAAPVTGRTHQIRVHTAAASFPIAGDLKYGSTLFNKRTADLGLNRLFLHAASITFIHPATDMEITVEAPLPSELEGVCFKLR